MKTKVLLAIPSLGVFMPEFRDNLNSLISAASAYDVQLMTQIISLPIVSQSRQTAVDIATRVGADRVVMIDDDVILSPRAFEYLLTTPDPISCVSYPNKKHDDLIVAGYWSHPRAPTETFPSPRLWMTRQDALDAGGEFAYCDWFGAGAIALTRSAYPYCCFFEFTKYPSPIYMRGLAMGEDVTFCAMVQLFGSDVFWSDLSPEYRSHGHKRFKLAYYPEIRHIDRLKWSTDQLESNSNQGASDA